MKILAVSGGTMPPDERTRVGFFLEGGGHQVDYAPDVRGAVAIAAMNRPDCVLVEEGTPPMELENLRRALAAGFPGAKTPIIAMGRVNSWRSAVKLLSLGRPVAGSRPRDRRCRASRRLWMQVLDSEDG